MTEMSLDIEYIAHHCEHLYTLVNRGQYSRNSEIAQIYFTTCVTIAPSTLAGARRYIKEKRTKRVYSTRGSRSRAKEYPTSRLRYTNIMPSAMEENSFRLKMTAALD